MKTLTHYFVPEWISIAFLILIPLPFILILFFLFNASKKHKNNAFVATLLFFVFYISYIIFGSFQGWFETIFFPPKVLLLTTFPYGFLLFVIVAKTKTFHSIVENVSLESLVKLHIFRIIGVFFVLLAVHNTLPKPFAFIAGFGDIITAITSVFVAKSIINKNKNAKKLTYFWNIFGTIDILFTAIAALVLTKISINTGNMGVDTLAYFPFCIIPAFAPPTILFLHYAIFKKLKQFST